MPVKQGKLGGKRGKFFLEVEGKQTALPFTLTTDNKTLEQLVGQDIEVFYAEPQVVAFRPVKAELAAALRNIIIICYVPADPFKISQPIARENVKQWTADAVKQGALTPELAEQLTKSLAE